MQTRGHVSHASRLGRSGCWFAVGGAVLFALIAVGLSVKSYNGIVAKENRVEQQWTEIGNQYKRRSDLVPALVETVKGAANFEQSTITAVTEARAAANQVKLAPGVPVDEKSAQEYLAAQRALGSSMSRLIATVEAYPDLKASTNFLSLQDQLEGTENRIAVARRDYIDAVTAYNTQIKQFPATLIASSFGFEKVPQLQFEPESTQVPDVKFDFNGGE